MPCNGSWLPAIPGSRNPESETRLPILCVLGLVILALTSCNKPASNSGKRGGVGGPVPVRVATVTRQDIPVELTNIGSVEACARVSVKAQVSGQVTEVHFKEGDFVRKGQLLFTIDPRPFQVVVDQAVANLAKAKAMAEQARAALARDKAHEELAGLNLERDSTLRAKGWIAQEELDSTRSNAAAEQATLRADEASVKSADETVAAAKTEIESAKLELEYCTIRSPIDGRTGGLLVHPGNLVRPTDTTAMLEINQITPIYVSFTLPERNLPVIQEAMARGPLTVVARIPKSNVAPITGMLTFVDNAVNQNAGTIRLKATFDNQEQRLWPGLFVTATLQIAMLSNAVVAPTSAVQTGQQGQYVYAVTALKKEDDAGTDTPTSSTPVSDEDASTSKGDALGMTVELRKVVTGETHDDFVVIQEGLQPEEQVVVDGHIRVVPGSPITILSDRPSEEKTEGEKE